MMKSSIKGMLIFKNKSLEKFKSHNLKRIENNESMLGRYIKLNVNGYSDKCTNF